MFLSSSVSAFDELQIILNNLCVKVFYLKIACTDFYARGDASEIRPEPVVAVKVVR